jgi:hypothetical protein
VQEILLEWGDLFGFCYGFWVGLTDKNSCREWWILDMSRRDFWTWKKDEY